MPQTFTKIFLTGSTHGAGHLVSGTATGSATTIHTAIAGTTSMDSITIFALNASATAVKLTLEWGGVTDPVNHIEQTIAAESGLVPVVVGLLLRNTLLVKAFAATGNVIVLYGDVTQIINS